MNKDKQGRIYGKNVALIGRLSDENPRIVARLLQKEHNLYLFNKMLSGKMFEGLRVYESIDDKPKDVDFNSAILYMNPNTIRNLNLHKKLVDFNTVVLPPGADTDEDLIKLIKSKGVEVKKECPRVRLSLLYP